MCAREVPAYLRAIPMAPKRSGTSPLGDARSFHRSGLLDVARDRDTVTLFEQLRQANENQPEVVWTGDAERTKLYRTVLAALPAVLTLIEAARVEVDEQTAEVLPGLAAALAPLEEQA